ncbi:MAG: hypothetical protein ACRCTL_08780 [Pseudomonas sp.]
MAVLIPSIATIFLLSPGTGSTSLSSWFMEHMGGMWIIPGKTGKHATPREIAATGLDMSCYTIATTTRNPFDFYISQYNKKRTWSGASPDFLLAKNNSFDVFLRKFLQQAPNGHLHPTYLNAADVVFRKEHLEQDVNLFLSKIGVQVSAKLPSINVAQNLSHNVHDWYDETLLSLVEQKHQAHLARFGYSRDHAGPQRSLLLSETILGKLASPQPASCAALVLPGKNGWLYLSDDSNRVVSSSTGHYDAHQYWIDAWKTEIAARDLHAQTARAAIGTYIAPNTHSAQPEQLPDGVTLSADRPIARLIDEVTGIDYLLDQLGDPDCFVANDSHYSEYGAYKAYRYICQQHGLSPLTIDKPDFESSYCLGDLGVKLFPAKGANQLILGHKKKEQLGLENAVKIFQSGVKSTGKLDVFYNQQAPLENRTLLILGDSYANKIARFMTHNFQYVVLLHSTRPPLELIGTLEPQLVFFIHSERFMTHAPQQQSAAHRNDYRTKLQQLASAQIAVGAPSYQLEQVAKLPGLLQEIVALENIYDSTFHNPAMNLGKLSAMAQTLLHRGMDIDELLDKARRHPHLASAMAEILCSDEFTSKNSLRVRIDSEALFADEPTLKAGA